MRTLPGESICIPKQVTSDDKSNKQLANHVSSARAKTVALNRQIPCDGSFVAKLVDRECPLLPTSVAEVRYGGCDGGPASGVRLVDSHHGKGTCSATVPSQQVLGESSSESCFRGHLPAGYIRSRRSLWHQAKLLHNECTRSTLKIASHVGHEQS